MITKKRLDIEIPRDIEALRELCVPIVKRFISQIKNKRASTYSIGKKTGVSYELIRLIVNKPDRNLSRKVMKKFVQTCTRRDLIQTVKIIHKEKGMFTCPK
jgi:threonine synthase